jgi:Flp pilus assembly protein CpaB
VKMSQRRLARPSLGGMLATRQGALILAVLCAVGAAAVLMFALSSYKRNVQTVTPQATVLVATGQIQKGTSGDLLASQKLVKSMPIIASQLAPGAISDSAQLSGKIAQADILPGQQLTTTAFSAAVGVGALLSPNQRAISIPTDEIHGDLDVLQPGDHIDMYAELAPPKSGPTIMLLVPNVLVVKTPGSAVLGAVPTVAAAGAAAAAAAAPTGGTAMIFALNTSVVPSVQYTADQGKIWIALRPTNAVDPRPGVTTLSSVLAQAASGANADAGASTSAKANAGASTTTNANTTTTAVTHP